MQAERIAQARLIARLNAAGTYGPAAMGGISPNIQWEVVIPGGRVDVVTYDRTDPNGDIELIELKQQRYGGVDDATDQLDRYRIAMPKGSENRNIVNKVFHHEDAFRVLVRDCPPLGGGTRLIRQFYVGSQPAAPGVVMVKSEDDETACPQNGTPAAIPDEAPVDDEQDWGERPPLVLPAPGQDDNDNGDDDFWDDFYQHFPELSPHQVPVEALDPAPVETLSLDQEILDLIASLLGTATVTTQKLVELSEVILEHAADAADLTSAVLEFFLEQNRLSDFQIYGDPHLTTLDGLHYSLQSVGEFHALQVPDSDIDVQVRFVPSNLGDISLLRRVATQVDGHTVELGVQGGAPSDVVVDGEEVDLASGTFRWIGDGGVLARSGDFYLLAWPTDDEPMAIRAGRAKLGFAVPGELDSKGLVGNRNSNQADDLALSTGTPIGTNPTSTLLHRAFADSWRLTDEDSLFTYADGESTETFTDLTRPQTEITLDDFTPTEIESATAVCVAADVAPGPQFDACIFDVIVTGDDSYAEDAALVTDVVNDPHARAFDSAGTLDEDFENSVAPNFRSARYLEYSNTTRLAGPLFDQTGYRFYARDMPRHDQLSIDFDLLALGPVTGAGAQTADILIDGEPATTIDFDASGGPSLAGPVPATITQTDSGTAGTEPFTRYQISFDLGHHLSSLDLAIEPNGFRGVLDTSLAVDDINLAVAAPPGQTFDVTLPLDVTAPMAAPLAGAGELGSPGDLDEYHFSLTPTAPRGMVLKTNIGACVEGLRYDLLDAEENLIYTQPSCNDRTTPALDPGDYVLRLSGAATDYTLSAFVVEEPQEFSYTIGTTVSLNNPASGAGNLENTAAVDRYNFTVPAPGMTLQYDTLAGLKYARLIDHQTDEVGSYFQFDRQLDLPAGDYTLEFSWPGVSGPYSFRIFEVPAPQTFAYTIGTTVSNGVPAAGAGNLETVASVDRYTFTAPAGGVTLSHEVVSKRPTFSLVDADTHEVITRSSTFERLTLPPGDYYLEYVGGTGATGTYSFRLLEVTPPQVFPLTIGTTVSNGVPSPGAGYLETSAATDQYTFDIAPGGANLFYDWISGQKRSTLTNIDTGEVFSLGFVDTRLSLNQGRHVLEFTEQTAGAYSFRLFESPEPQDFEYPLGTDVSDGVPWPGAGNLETIASIDRYHFTVDASLLGVRFVRKFQSSAFRVNLIDKQTGESLGNMVSNQIRELDPGDYILEVTYLSGPRYAFVIEGVAATNP